MHGHFPTLDRGALQKLRRLARSMADRQNTSLPMRDLVELACEACVGAPPETGAGVTVDFEATHELGEPMIVVRVPQRGERRSPVLDSLTPREREIAGLVAQGLLNKQIARRLGVTVATVKDHIHNVLEKTGLPNRAAIAAAVAESR